MPRRNNSSGFTIVELLVVAPIVILVIGGFIGAIIAMTGNVLVTRSANQLVYNIQDALDRIESDVRISGGFLTTITGFSYDNPSLILNSYATTNNPASSALNIVYRSLSADSCSSPTDPLMLNTVYFVSDNKLWRRIVVPDDFSAGIFCDATTNSVTSTSVWQKPSCATAACISKDMLLVDGATSLIIDIKYYSPSEPNNFLTTPQPDANSGVVVTITADGSAAGRTFTESGTIRATSPNNYFDAS